MDAGDADRRSATRARRSSTASPIRSGASASRPTSCSASADARGVRLRSFHSAPSREPLTAPTRLRDPRTSSSLPRCDGPSAVDRAAPASYHAIDARHPPAPRRWTAVPSAPRLLAVRFACSLACQSHAPSLRAPDPRVHADRRRCACPPSRSRAQAEGPEPRRPFTAWSESVHSFRDSLVTVARAQIGTKYVLGGTTPNGFDCSGLVRYVMAALKVELPRTAAQQAPDGSRRSTATRATCARAICSPSARRARPA